MSKIVGDVAVMVGADISAFEKGMKKSRKSMHKFGRDGDAMAKRMAKVGVTIAAAAAATGAALVGLAHKVGDTGKEIQNLSRIAGTTPEVFQRWAVASRTVGVEKEKLSDILKDVQDRVGDFLETGGGPMADFFENIAPQVGVTADQFARLSGPEALQLYVSSLEAANLTQSQMTFYLEAMSSDLTSLLPLLRNGGAEMQRLGDKAESAGVIMSNETVEGAAQLKDRLVELRDEITGNVVNSLIGLEDELALLLEFVNTYGVPALNALISGAAGAAQWFDNLAKKIQSLGGNPRFFDELGNEYDQYNNLIDSPNMTIGDPLTSGSENLLPPLQLEVEDGETTRPTRPLRGGGGLDLADLERFREMLATEAQELEMWRMEQLEKLREFREAKLTTEEEYNALEEQINQEHADRLAEVERRAQQQRLSQFSGAFGDLGSLMQNENKKLFKIGQAAAVADAVVNGYSAAVAAWEKGMKVGGPPVASAFAAASMAKTTALIGGIQSAGSSGGGGGLTAGGTATAAEAAPSTYYNVTLGGEGAISRSSVRDFIEALNNEIDDGAVIRGITVS